jgi:serine/threonine protein kinase
MKARAEAVLADDAKRLALQVASAMEYITSKGVLHRDIAARNVLVMKAQPLEVKLADFGLSRSLLGNEDYYRAQSQDQLPFR